MSIKSVTTAALLIVCILFAETTSASFIAENYFSPNNQNQDLHLSTVGNQIRDTLHLAGKAGEIENINKELREIEELEAQKETAYWAEPMFWATVGSGILAGFSLIGLFLNISQNTKNITLASETLALSRKTSQAQLRAYVSVVLSDSYKELFTKKPHPYLSITFKNSGSSPALDFKYCMEITFVPVSDVDTFRPVIKEMYNTGAKMILPGQEHSAARILNDEDQPGLYPSFINQVFLKKYSMFVFGKVTYSDVFGDIHSTEFNQKIYHFKDGKVIAQFGEYGNDVD